MRAGLKVPDGEFLTKLLLFATAAPRSILLAWCDIDTVANGGFFPVVDGFREGTLGRDLYLGNLLLLGIFVVFDVCDCGSCVLFYQARGITRFAHLSGGFAHAARGGECDEFYLRKRLDR